MDDGISVVIPAYNAADTLPRAIESVLNQTHDNLELIIVDDASKDNTEEVVKKYKQKDSRLTYIKHEENKERSAARNTGINNATKPFVAFLDADDQWLPGKLEQQLSYLKGKGKEWVGVYCDTTTIRANSKSKFSISVGENLPKEGGKEMIKTVLLQKTGRFGSTLLSERKLLEKTGGFDESLNQNEDFEFIGRILREGKIAYLDKELAIINKDGNSFPPEYSEKVKTQLLKMFKDEIDIFESQGYPVSSLQFIRISKNYFREANYNRGFKFFLKSIQKLGKCDFGNIKIILVEYVSLLKHISIGLVS